MLTFIVVALFAGVVGLDYIPERKQRLKKEKWVYLAMLSVSFAVLLLYSLDVKLAGPAALIKAIIDAMGLSH